MYAVKTPYIPGGRMHNKRQKYPRRPISRRGNIDITVRTELQLETIAMGRSRFAP